MLHGIDISSWQGGLDLSKVQCDFVIMKATGGTKLVDETCDGFYQKAKSLGKKLGFYHFAREYGYGASTGVDEANWFYNNCKNYFHEAIPILDWERDTSLGPKWAKAFLDRIYELSGVKPVIYMSQSTVFNYDWSDVVKGNYGLWVAQYDSYNPVYSHQNKDCCNVAYWNFACMYQYTSSGRLSGYNGNLDLDIFYGDTTAWDSYAGKQSTTPKPEEKPPVVIPSTPSSYNITKIVNDVIAGKYGNGDDRRIALTKAGYDYNAIQNAVNAKLSNVKSKYNATRIAKEIWTGVGDWGVGSTRKARVESVGVDYNEVQRILATYYK